MSPTETRGSVVVVGIDGIGTADDALDWATAEAAARGCRLRIVHAFHPPLLVDPYGVVPPLGDLPVVWAGAEQVLASAVARARSVAPDLPVTSRLLQATAVSALLGEARDACVLVLGSRGRRGLRGRWSRSIPVQVAAHAPCPVVIIRLPDVLDARLSPPRVVVGVDASTSCTGALGFAFHAAGQRGVPLIAVHAWTPDPPGDLEAVTGPSALAEALAGRILDRALDRWRSAFAAVSVHTVLVRGEPAHALIATSHGAALLVIGTRGRGRVMKAVLGSVSDTVLRHSRCPLAIIHYDTARTPHSAANPEREHRSGHDKSYRRRIIPRNRRWHI
jgi:nucleotide-binding universal stress UspA family protein